MSRPSFEEILARDVDAAFINPDEFGSIHILDGKEMHILIDDNEIIEREKKMKSNMDGIFAKQKLIYVKPEEFGPEPARGRQIVMDGKPYRVLDATNESGLYSILMESNRSR